MSPSDKDEKDLRELPSPLTDGAWTLMSGEYDGAPLLARYNQSAQAWCAHPRLPIKLGFAIPLNEPNPGGLPSPSENQQLDAIEDLILASVAAATPAMSALALTNGVMKELIFYIPAGVDIEALHRSIAASVPTHEVQCMAVVETDWDTYRQFTP